MSSHPLDDHLDALGEQLLAGQQRGDRRRSRTLAGGLLSTAALAAGIAAATLVPGGASRLDPVAEARAAVSPADGGILHYVVRTAALEEDAPLTAPQPESPGIAVWTTVARPAVWRTRYPSDGRPWACGSVIITKHPARAGQPSATLVEPTETAYRPHRRSTYSPFSRIIVHQQTDPGTPYFVPGQAVYGPAGEDAADPITFIRRALDRKQLRDAGTVELGGRSLRRLTGEIDERTARARARHRQRGERHEPTKVTLLVDPDDFTPVLVRVSRHLLWSRAGGRARYRTMTLGTSFSEFQRLPDTPENRRLLEIQVPSRTKVVEIPLERVRTDAKRLPIRSKGSPAAKRRCEAARRR